VLDDYYKTREETIDFYHKLSKKIAKLRLRGISSWKPKHFKLMYALRSGVLIPPSAEKSLYDPQAYVGTGKTKEKALRRGLFNPHVVFGNAVITTNYKNNDPFMKISGTRDDMHTLGSQLFNFPEQQDIDYFGNDDTSLFV
jgi:hypothetical protein